MRVLKYTRRQNGIMPMVMNRNQLKKMAYVGFVRNADTFKKIFKSQFWWMKTACTVHMCLSAYA